MTPAKAHHYAIDAACLLETCLVRLRETIALDVRGRHKALLDMEEAIVTTERLLHGYMVQLIDAERETMDDPVPATLSECIDTLQTVLEAKNQKKLEFLQARPVRRTRTTTSQSRRKKNANVSITADLVTRDIDTVDTNQSAGDSSRGPNTRATFDHSRSATDTLLFRLIVALQLCLVRIGDARFVITGRRDRDDDREDGAVVRSSSWSPFGIAGTAVCVLGIGSAWMLRRSVRADKQPQLQGVFVWSGKLALMTFAGRLIVKEWGNLWMTAKIQKSTAAVEEWQEQWLFVQTASRGSHSAEQKSQRLVQYAMSQSPKSSLWHSEGEIRFLLLKRAMDLLYASVGTAVEATKDTPATKQGKMGWKLPLTAAAAASYYSLTGPSRRALEAVSSSSLSLIQYAWGMVSLPAIKQLSLRASRLLKGAAIAERVIIAGVPCFILSADPVTDLSAAIMREQRRQRRLQVARLSTIQESAESIPSLATNDLPPPRRSYQNKDVILHLTGGGFFAHTIASDCPFLLDWSKSANAVVVCPEYSLLPANTFPVALDEVVDVYCSLVSGAAADVLGICVDRVVVTGESAGGNLTVALCAKLCLENMVDVNALVASNHDANDANEMKPSAGELDHEADSRELRLPDALMLSCPALNLSLELSPSRVLGNQDPVLPSGLISAISDAYLPPVLGISKKDPLASPFYAPDDVMRIMPPTLIFAGSEDPLLDDSVDFNRRLRSLGVESELRAVSHMPHAYWGLGTAGFPEAKQVQQECEAFLVRQFAREPNETE